jgi:hypothetical protein
MDPMNKTPDQRAQEQSRVRISEALKTGKMGDLTDAEAIYVLDIQRNILREDAMKATNMGLAWRMLVSVCPADRWQIVEGLVLTSATAGIGYYLSTKGYSLAVAASPPLLGTVLFLGLNHMANNPEASRESIRRVGEFAGATAAHAWNFVRPWSWDMFDKQKKAALAALQGLEQEMLTQLRKDISTGARGIEVYLEEIELSSTMTDEEKATARMLAAKLGTELGEELKQKSEATVKEADELADEIMSAIDSTREAVKKDEPLDPEDVGTLQSLNELIEDQAKKAAPTIPPVEQETREAFDTGLASSTTLGDDLMPSPPPEPFRGDVDLSKVDLGISEETLRDLGIEETVEELQEIAANANEAVKELGPIVVKEEPDHRVVDIGLKTSRSNIGDTSKLGGALQGLAPDENGIVRTGSTATPSA